MNSARSTTSNDCKLTIRVPNTRARSPARCSRDSRRTRQSAKPERAFSKSPSSQALRPTEQERPSISPLRRGVNDPIHLLANTLRTLGVDRGYIGRAIAISRDDTFRNKHRRHFPRGFDIEAATETIYRLKILDRLCTMEHLRQINFDSAYELRLALEDDLGFSLIQVDRAFQFAKQKSQEFSHCDLKVMTNLILLQRDEDRERHGMTSYQTMMADFPVKLMPAMMATSGCDTSAESHSDTTSEEKYDEATDDEEPSLFEFASKEDNNIPFPDHEAERVLTIEQQLKAINARNGDLVIDMFDELFEYVLSNLRQKNVSLLRRLKIDGVAADKFEDFSEEYSAQFEILGWSMTWSRPASLVLERI